MAQEAAWKRTKKGKANNKKVVTKYSDSEAGKLANRRASRKAYQKRQGLKKRPATNVA